MDGIRAIGTSANLLHNTLKPAASPPAKVIYKIPYLQPAHFSPFLRSQGAADVTEA
jgi:hypothetical protein